MGQIRVFDTKDLDEVMEIWLICNLQVHDFISKKYWQNNFGEVQRVMQLATVYVWEEEGKILGFIGALEGFVAGLFVTESAQGKGIGTALLNKMKETFDTLSLGVYEKNVKAVRFYMKEGFKVQSERTEESTGAKELLLAWEK